MIIRVNGDTRHCVVMWVFLVFDGKLDPSGRCLTDLVWTETSLLHIACVSLNIYTTAPLTQPVYFMSP